METTDSTLHKSPAADEDRWPQGLAFALRAAVAVNSQGNFVADPIIGYRMIAAPCVGPDWHCLLGR